MINDNFKWCLMLLMAEHKTIEGEKNL